MTDESTKTGHEAPAPGGGWIERRKRWFEPATVILMALTTISTTWCSYESSRWSGQSSGYQNHTNELQRRSLALSVESNQVQETQISIFMSMIDAKLNGNEKVADFYAARISGELKPAYEKWMTLKPFENASAPPHPFVPGLYVPRYAADIKQLNDQAALAQTQANISGRNAASYLSNTVLLAAVLFFAGTAGKFNQQHVRTSSFFFAAAFFLYAVVKTFLLPVA
jgi:hypothetical protein